MVLFAIEPTTANDKEDKKVKAFFRKVRGKLEDENFLFHPLRGSVGQRPGGVYILDVAPVLPRALFSYVGFFVLIAGVLAWAMGLLWVAWFGLVFAGLSFGAGWSFNSGLAYRGLLTIQLSRLCGRLVWCRDAKEDILREVLYGTK